jgi:hypothetical protein
MTPEFIPFPKIPRLFRDILITEKIDGTNATVAIINTEGRPVPCAIAQWESDGTSWSMLAGSRSRWITPEKDNANFAKWVQSNVEELKKLGEGIHRGEWWGSGIQRGYGLDHKRFSLFNATRFAAPGEELQRIPHENPLVEKRQEYAPDCCHVVPVLYRGIFDQASINVSLRTLREHGSFASPGFMDPEGIVIYHMQGGVGFKVTLQNDEKPKTKI